MEVIEPSTFVVLFNSSYNFDLPEFDCENGIGEQLRCMRNKPWEFQGIRFNY